MSTRWHEQDLHGQLIPEEPAPGDRWAVLNLPALAVEDQACPLGRKAGEALCPARFSAAELRETRDGSAEGKVWFEALYQGNPSLDEGNIIKRPFNRYELSGGMYRTVDEHGAETFVSEDDVYRFGTLDVAGTDTKRSDFTVLVVMDVSKENPRRMFVRAVERVRITTEHHEKHVLDWYERYGLQALHVEDRTFGTNLIRRLTGMPGIVVQKLKADTSKVIRALPIQYEILNQMLWFPTNADWLREFEAELTKFPNTTHDDQVDALGYAVQVAKALPPWFDRKREPATMEERMTAHIQELAGRNRKGRRRLPGIGRW